MWSAPVARGALLVCALALACGGEESKPSGAPLARQAVAPTAERVENEAPVVERLLLHPPAPLAGQQIEARLEVSDPDGDPVRLELEWRQAGRVIARGARTTVAPEGLAKGDEVAVTVTATDGRATSEPVHASVAVGNTPPLIRAFYLAPNGEIAPGQEVTAAPQAADADGDQLEFEYAWLLNGQPARGAETATFDTAKLKRGDRLQAHVRVSDGEAWSPVSESMTLTLANRAPQFAPLPPTEVSNGKFRVELSADDPDGDPSLRFRLLQGPEGMSVDPVSGWLSWRPGREEIGNHVVEVAVADAYGAESAMRFELSVGGGGADGKAAPAKRAEVTAEGRNAGDDAAEGEGDVAEPDADAADLDDSADEADADEEE